MDEGGDFELRFFAPMTPAGGGYVRTPETDFGDLELDLDDAAGLQSELSAVTDGELTSGVVGMRAFAINGNSSFFDDLTVLDIVFTDGFESGDTMAWTLAVP